MGRAWIILIKGFTPIPFKLVTIASGIAAFNFPLFVLLATITRGARFFLIAFLLKRYGAPVQEFIEKRLDLGRLGGADRSGRRLRGGGFAVMLLAAALVLQAAAPADPLAGDWLPVREQADYRLEVDESATTRDGDIVQVRLRMELLHNPPDGGRWGIVRMALNCRRGTGNQLSIRVYTAEGRLVADNGGEDADDVREPQTEEARQFLEATCHRTGWGEEGDEE